MNNARKKCPNCGGKASKKGGRIAHTKDGCRLPRKSGAATPDRNRATAVPKIRVERGFEASIRELAKDLGETPKETLEAVGKIGAELLRKTQSIDLGLVAFAKPTPKLSERGEKFLAMLRARSARAGLLPQGMTNEASFDLGIETAAALFGLMAESDELCQHFGMVRQHA